MSLIILILIGLLILFLSQINYRKIYLSFKIPGPIPLPFIGNALYFFNKSPEEIFEVAVKLTEDYGDNVSLWIGTNFGALLSNPEHIKVILTSAKFIEKSEAYRYLKPWLNEGLLLSSGSKWYQRRKIITPSFHFKALDEHVKIFDRYSIVFVDILSKYKTTDKVELSPLTRHYTLDVVCEAAMGIEVNAQRHPNSEYVKAVRTVSQIMMARLISGFKCADTIFRFSPLYKQQANGLKIIHAFTDRVIQERRQKLVALRNKSGNSVDMATSTTFLDILLEGIIDGKPLSNSDIREEVDTFMLEGHDTAKTGISFCFYSLARYPEIQQKCFEEMRNILSDDRSKEVSCNELNNLRYLDLVIKETLRLYPSLPLLGRLLCEELTIGKYKYPKGTNIGFSPLLLGRDPKLFENPLEFRPERFLEDTTSEKFTFSYLPFSAGPRNCVGQKYAVLEIKAVVSKVLRHFEISLADDSKSDPVLIGEFILATKNPINYHFKPRIY
ncbi:cytochrome P450 4d1-like [Bradysia coprophila]|uniref:cytochrome P450 4d1-like n=1 Tax=Bradysia coprophila TaxID=38358 RepID=UPI00187DC1C9|nr:cytochrome P450 4d1-like [Bradysia coprophila]XP_037052056.1 cytochrome P450 4d1-like [Bradysia coprophila]